jgi:hypothetical protein
MDDPLAPARGILIALLLGALIWLAVIVWIIR